MLWSRLFNLARYLYTHNQLGKPEAAKCLLGNVRDGEEASIGLTLSNFSGQRRVLKLSDHSRSKDFSQELKWASQ